jgi:hypothetical protein
MTRLVLIDEFLNTLDVRSFIRRAAIPARSAAAARTASSEVDHR